MSKTRRQLGNPVQRFGGSHTTSKQSVVVDYLRAYAKLMVNQNFHISYVDAFAGCGQRVAAWHREQDVVHSEAQHDLGFARSPPPTRTSTAIEALRLEPGFHRYVFGDLNARHIRALADVIARGRAAGERLPEPILRKADANDLIRDECAWLEADGMRRSVMFLDPYGMQVEWKALEAIASTVRSDLWLLLPTGIAVNRLLPRRSAQHPAWARKLDAFFGAEDWREAFTKKQTDLLGSEGRVVETNTREILGYTMSRLGELFGNGLYPEALELKIRGKPAYHLVFACASGSTRAIELSHRIAGHLLKRGHAGN